MERGAIKCYWLVLLLLIVPFLFIFQGLDFTDMGYFLVSSRDMLNDPGNVHSHMSIFSALLNGVWLKLSESWGIVGAKFGLVLILWGIFAASYSFLKDFMSPTQIFGSLSITFLFTPKLSSWISYNDVTSFLACLSLALLYFGVKSKKGRFFLLAGIFCALNAFARFPNILMVGFGLLPLIAQCLFHANISDRAMWKNAGIFYIGYAGMLCSFIIFMMVCGYWEHYLNSIVELFVSNTKNTIYSTESLFRGFVEDHKRILSLGVLFTISGTGFALFLERWKCSIYFLFPLLLFLFFYMGWKYYGGKFQLHPFFFWIAFFCFLYQIWFVLKKRHAATNFPLDSVKTILVMLTGLLVLFVASINYLYVESITLYDSLFGVIYIALMISMLRAWNARIFNLFFALFAAFAMLITVPLGSGNGIFNAIYGLWFSLPLTLKMIGENFSKEKSFSARVSSQRFDAFRLLKWITLVALLTTGSAIAFRYTYRDTANRWEMHFAIDHPKLYGVRTTRDRARVVQEVLEALRIFVVPGDFLLGYHTVSTLYFLTETHPYLYSAWPFLRQPALFRYYLEKAERERPAQPVVVRSKYSLQSFEWPRVKFRNPSTHYVENWKTMEDFLQKNSYIKVWENEIFEIFKKAMDIPLPENSYSDHDSVTLPTH